MLKWLADLCESVIKGNRESPTVIHLNTGIPQQGGVPVALAEALTLVSQGLLPRIYFTIPRYYPPDPSKYIRRVVWTDTTSMLKVTLELTNVRFSELSTKPGRILICASYFNETTGSPKPPPLLSGVTERYVFPTLSGQASSPPKLIG